MKNIFKLMTIATLSFSMVHLTIPPAAQAEMKMHTEGNFMKKGMHISGPWASPTAAGEKEAAAFMTIMNHRRDDVVLTEIKTEAAEKAVIHTVVTKDGKRLMEPAENGLPLAKHQIVNMEPGGIHIMLMGLKAPLKDGTTIPMTLIFDKAGPIDIKLSIAKPQTAPKAMKSMDGSQRGSHKGKAEKEHRGSHNSGDKKAEPTSD